ncbi:YggT family protein [Thermaerobacter subterraneus]|uniref:Integral membrane protein n=1 Tax=Thermaerobacter subterraneus DSM 13965 TaxID=867903 RepID=K6QFQ3_9FIRM|nr:YggT family protein [Thermaerobacter subterraneus]EKP95886.1 putative integral membrane protein [Thermaerobacter subterraneus DSM 13965]
MTDLLVLFLVRLIQGLATAFFWLLLIRVIMSWFIQGNYNRTFHDIYRVLVQLTEPVLAPIRRVMPATGPLDLSPLVALLLVQLVERLLVSLLYRLFG